MAIVFVKQKKGQRNLLIILALIIVVTVIVFWRGFSEGEEPLSTEEVFSPSVQNIEIDFGIFERLNLDDFQLFEEIKPLEEVPLTEGAVGVEKGRENPFILY